MYNNEKRSIKSMSVYIITGETGEYIMENI